MANTSDEIADLLKQLEDKGAQVRRDSNQGAKISPEILADLKKNVSTDFNAWVSWTKSF
jgi:hypothetical protein